MLAAAAMLPGFTVYDAPPGGGTLLRGTIPVAHAPGAVAGYVYLPPGFTTTQRYPVAYLLHGIRGLSGQYVASLQLRSWADGEITSGALKPFIAVVPGGAGLDYRGEWAGVWGRYVVDSVRWIDSHLPTVAAPAGRVIAGLSAGGYGAYDIGLRHPGLFGRLESWSGYFKPIPDAPFKNAAAGILAANDPRLLVPKEAQRLRALRTRFYVSCGPSHGRWDSPQASYSFVRLARRNRIPATYRFFPSAGHWRAEFHAGLEWAFGTAR